MQNLSQKIYNSKINNPKMFGTKISVFIATISARRYVGAGLGGCARSRLRMSMAASVLLLKEWYSRVQIL